MKPYWRAGEITTETFMVDGLPRAGVAHGDGHWVAWLNLDEGIDSNVFDNRQDAKDWCEITLKLLCGL